MGASLGCGVGSSSASCARLFAWVPALALLCVSAGCGAPPDPRFAEPEATVQTLFTAYDVERLEEAEVQELLRQRVQFQLRDRAAYQACFSDWRSPHDEGLAGFVFGRLAAVKDHLRYEHASDDQGALIRVVPVRNGDPGHPVILRQTDAGWKIALRESVPTELRQRLYRVYEEARRRERG